MNPLKHFGIKNKFIRSDMSYNYAYDEKKNRVNKCPTCEGYTIMTNYPCGKCVKNEQKMKQWEVIEDDWKKHREGYT